MRCHTVPAILIVGLISGVNVAAASQVVYVQAPNAVHLPDTGGMYLLAAISSTTKSGTPDTVCMDSALYAIMEAHDPEGDLVIGPAFPTNGDAVEGGTVVVVPVDVSFQNDWYRVELSDSVNVADFVSSINQGLEGLAYAEPRYRVHLDGDLVPNDPLWEESQILSLWSHWLPQTWGMGVTGSSQVAVGVLDADIDRNHPDFAGVEFFGTAGNGSDYHGSAVASVIRAATNNSYLMAGINWGARIGAYRIHTSDQSGIASSLTAAASAGCQIINCSWHVVNSSGGSVNSVLVEQAVAAAMQAGVIVIAAAGNDGPDPWWPHYPAGYTKKALAVGGQTVGGTYWENTNTLSGVDFVACADTFGVALTWGQNHILNFDGTSFATAIVSGIASLLLEYGFQHGQQFDIDDATTLLAWGAWRPSDPSEARRWGYGVPRPNLTVDWYLKLPKTVERFEFEDGGWTETVVTERLPFRLPGIPVGDYTVQRHELKKTVTFPRQFYRYSVSGAWANQRLCRGGVYATSDNGLCVCANQSGEVLTWSDSSAMIFTCWYEIPGHGAWPISSSSDAKVAISVVGERLLVSPNLTARPADLRLTIDWVDTLPNESAWQVDRWHTDYAVLPPGTTSFVDSNVVLGSYLYTYRVRPVNAHQTPAYSNEVTKRSLPCPPPCVSAYTVYMNLCSANGDPSLCPQNHGTCGGEIELEGPLHGGMAGPEGMAPEMQQMSSGGGGIDPSCCEPWKSNVIIVEWQRPLQQQSGTIRGYHVVQRTSSGGSVYDTYYPRVTGLADTICCEFFNHSYTFSVVTEDIDGQLSCPQLPFVTVATGSWDWCNGGEPLERRSTDAVGETSTVHRRFALQPNRPNPFNSGTVLSFTLAQPENWEIEVLDILGRVVWSKEGHGDAGLVDVTYDGRDDSGRDLASGTYFWRVTTPTASGVRKMSIVK